jgi:hypothetical protein
MQAMRWSWQDLEDTPMYVRQYCWDLHQIKVQAAADRRRR